MVILMMIVYQKQLLDEKQKTVVCLYFLMKTYFSVDTYYEKFG